MADDKKTITQEKKTKSSVSKVLQTVIITVAVVVVAIGSVIYGIRFVMKNEGIYELEEYAESKTKVLVYDDTGSTLPPGQSALEENSMYLTDYVRMVLDGLNDAAEAKVDMRKNISVAQQSIKGEDEAFIKDIRYMAKNIADNAEKKYFPAYTGVFGQENPSACPVFALQNEDIRFALLSQGIPTEESLRELIGDKLTVMPAQETELLDASQRANAVNADDLRAYADSVKDNENGDDYYYIYIDVKPGTLDEVLKDSISDTFRIAENFGTLQMLKGDIAQEVTADASVLCTSLTVTARINRLTDRLDRISYNGKFVVDMNAQFKGSLAKYAKQHFTFEYATATEYTAQYAGLQLAQTELYVEKGDEMEIPCVFHTQEDADAVFTWRSENPEIAQVTENGFVTGKEYSAKPVKVYAHAEYLGKSYDVSLDVYVIKPVENIVLEEKELTLSVGETHTLYYTVMPDDATITDALWFSSDENVVSVDENGVLHAHAAGCATVRAVSVNEHYQSTCTVTVQ